jgi:chromosome segregation and condensation protein ScpB
MGRKRAAAATPHFDPELDGLPAELRWREWMTRVEAVIFAAPEPVPREVLSRLVGSDCRLDDLIADIRGELAPRPYDLLFVAGGWTFRTRTSVADAIRVAEAVPNTAGPDLTPTEVTVLAIIAYRQPITRAELSRSCGSEIGREVIGRLRSEGLIGAGPRAPEPGAPLTYVTTDRFLSVFNLATIRDLPDIEALEEMGLLTRAVPDPTAQVALDAMLGIAPDDEAPLPGEFSVPGIDE